MQIDGHGSTTDDSHTNMAATGPLMVTKPQHALHEADKNIMASYCHIIDTWYMPSRCSVCLCRGTAFKARRRPQNDHDLPPAAIVRLRSTLSHIECHTNHPRCGRTSGGGLPAAALALAEPPPAEAAAAAACRSQASSVTISLDHQLPAALGPGGIQQEHCPHDTNKRCQLSEGVSSG